MFADLKKDNFLLNSNNYQVLSGKKNWQEETILDGNSSFTCVKKKKKKNVT